MRESLSPRAGRIAAFRERSSRSEIAIRQLIGARRTSIQSGHGMINRITTTHSPVSCRLPTLTVMLAALAALTVTAEAAAKPKRPAPVTEAVAPRQAGEPIMAVVSIKSQQVAF